MIVNWLKERKSMLAEAYTRSIDDTVGPLEQIATSWWLVQSSLAEYTLLEMVIGYMEVEIKAGRSDEHLLLFDTGMDIALRSMNNRRHLLFHNMFAAREHIRYTLQLYIESIPK